METNMNTFIVSTVASAESITTRMAGVDDACMVANVEEMVLPERLYDKVQVFKGETLATLSSVLAVIDDQNKQIVARDGWLASQRAERTKVEGTLNKVWEVIKEYLVEEEMTDPDDHEITKRLLTLGMPPFTRTVECTFRAVVDVTIRVNEVPFTVGGEQVMDALSERVEYAICEVSVDDSEIAVRDRNGDRVHLSEVTLYDISSEIDEQDYDEED